MNTRKNKIEWLKNIFTGKVNPADLMPAKCDLIVFYPELKKPFYFFVDGKEVTNDGYMEASKRNEKNFGRTNTLEDKDRFGRLYMGTGSGSNIPDPLPHYFDIKAETL
ncbi:MAG: hypothetical protein HZA79_05060 [Sphingobacteriales bacterium]|nr:hypothetical protein [Sphingobacteriales bacterium]